MSINKRQADVFVIITNIILKSIVTIVTLVIYIWILVKLFEVEPKWEKTLPLGLIESILTYTIYKMYDHFFPKASI
jgi:ABC-type iron transport system FetAB permease component